MKSISKKITAVILSAAMLVTGLFFAPAKSEAAGFDDLLVEQGQATAGQEITYDYTVKRSDYVCTDLTVSSLTGVNISTYKAGQCIDTRYVSANDTGWKYDSDYQAYYYAFVLPNALSTGDYQVKLNFDSGVNYILMVYQEKATPVISNKSVTITKGFTKQLSVKDAGGSVKWSSSKKSVATVSSKGKVTAKKKGTATISAKTKDGTVLKCKVTVKDNLYTGSKPVVSQVPYGKSILSVYRMSYDKSGNLLIKCRYINNIGYRVVKLQNFGVTPKSPSGKVMGSVSVKSMNVNVPSGSAKDITLKIKKSKLKIKKADLRNSSYSMKTGKSIYKIYY